MKHSSLSLCVALLVAVAGQVDTSLPSWATSAASLGYYGSDGTFHPPSGSLSSASAQPLSGAQAQVTAFGGSGATGGETTHLYMHRVATGDRVYAGFVQGDAVGIQSGSSGGNSGGIVADTTVGASSYIHGDAVAVPAPSASGSITGSGSSSGSITGDAVAAPVLPSESSSLTAAGRACC
jgi:hypothetical protein